MRILFVNGSASSNKGSIAIVKSAKQALQLYLPDAQFGALIPPSSSPVRYRACGVEVIQIPSRKQAIFIALECVLWRVCKGLFGKVSPKLERGLFPLQYDLFVDVSGNCFRDSWGLLSLFSIYIPCLLDFSSISLWSSMGRLWGRLRHGSGDS